MSERLMAVVLAVLVGACGGEGGGDPVAFEAACDVTYVYEIQGLDGSRDVTSRTFARVELGGEYHATALHDVRVLLCDRTTMGTEGPCPADAGCIGEMPPEPVCVQSAGASWETFTTLLIPCGSFRAYTPAGETTAQTTGERWNDVMVIVRE
jgi:hypothetical protein